MCRLKEQFDILGNTLVCFLAKLHQKILLPAPLKLTDYHVLCCLLNPSKSQIVKISICGVTGCYVPDYFLAAHNDKTSGSYC